MYMCTGEIVMIILTTFWSDVKSRINTDGLKAEELTILLTCSDKGCKIVSMVKKCFMQGFCILKKIHYTHVTSQCLRNAEFWSQTNE